MAKGTPYIGFNKDRLDKQRRVELGEKIVCPHCGDSHELFGSDDGGTFLMCYKCDDKLYLGAIDHCLIVGLKPDVKGEV
jgi:hypothetical protein